MTHPIDLPADPADALRSLTEASLEAPVVVFKRSPICPVSHKAEWEFKQFLKGLAEDDDLRVASVDVIGERALARGLTAELGVQHESPQALWFRDGQLAWHASHGDLTAAAFRAQREA